MSINKNNFTGGYSLSLLYKAIRNSSIGHLLTGPFTEYTNTITPGFSHTLTSEENTILQSVIENHDPDQYLEVKGYPDQHISGGPECVVSIGAWQSVRSFRYPGKAKAGYPDTIYATISVENSSVDGYIRIYDITNNVVVATFDKVSSTSPTTVSFSPNTRSRRECFPVDAADFSIQLKRNNGSGKVYFHSLYFDYS